MSNRLPDTTIQTPDVQDTPPPRPAWQGGSYGHVPAWIYSDQALYAKEQERVFRNSWNYVALAAELPENGSFKRSWVGDAPVVVTRDRDGAVHCVVNRCAHRGVEFVRELRGTLKCIRCPYHQWTYALDGRLTGVPFRRGVGGKGGMPPDFDPSASGLQQLAVTERNGVIFASFASEPPSFEQFLGTTMLGYFDRVFDGRQLEILGYSRQRIPCNWKLVFENIKDPYHASTLHVFLVTFGLFRADTPAAVKMDPTGAHSVLISSKRDDISAAEMAELATFRKDLSLNEPELVQPITEFDDPHTAVMQTVWPNLIVQQQVNTLATRHIVPRGPDQVDLLWTFFGYVGEDPVLRHRRLLQANLMGPAGLVSVDDGEVLQQTQDGASAYPEANYLVEMGGRDLADTDHMVTEVAIRAFYRHYREVMDL